MVVDFIFGGRLGDFEIYGLRSIWWLELLPITILLSFGGIYREVVDVYSYFNEFRRSPSLLAPMLFKLYLLCDLSSLLCRYFIGTWFVPVVYWAFGL